MNKGMRTQQRILDAAEQLFPDAGINGVSMRDIAERAEVGLGVLTYHFKTKEEVFRAVIARRASELNRHRRKSLAALSDDASLEDVLHAFMHPYVRLVRDGGPGWRAYARIIVQAGQSVYWSEEVSRHFQSLSREIIARMIKAEPNLSNNMAVRAFVHVVSTMINVMAPSSQLERNSNGRLSSGDLDGAYGPMLAFVVGGIREMTRIASAPREMAARRA